jgi:murein DD-endopeptidase MepM/ murein hydrolase activator NlpD/muramidase (phage lysozyme)
MVLTLKSYAPLSKPSTEDSTAIDFQARILTRYGAVLIDFGKLQDIISYSDNLAVDGGSGNWSIRMKATSDNINLLKNIHPGLCLEVYCSRGANTLEGVHFAPDTIVRKDSSPKIPKVEKVQVVTPTGASDIGALTTGVYQGMHPNVAAFLEMLRDGEGTRGDKGFTTMFTGAQFSGFADHPRQIQSSGGLRSDAAGAYQFLSTTWDPIAARLGLKDFSPRSQALAAQEKLKDRGIYEAVVRGDLVAALGNASYEWASLPSGPGGGGRYGQPNHTYEEVVKIFEQAKQAIGGRVSADPNAVGPAFQPPPATAPQVAKVSAGPDTSRAGKVTMARTGKKDSNNLEILKLTVHDKSGNPLGTYNVNSGIASTQTKFGGAFTTAAGSKAPVEFGEFRIGQPVATVENQAALGRTFIPIDPTFETNRSAIGFHVDGDRSTAAGSAGCIVFATTAEFDKFQADLQKSGATTFVFEKEPVAATASAPTGETVQANSPDVIGPAVEPQEDPYLDKCPYLLMRGIITDYGRATDNSSNLTLTGSGYGKVYEDAVILTDATAPELASQSLEVRQQATIPLGVSYIYYRILREWVEGFWGEPNGWEARTRVIPFPPNYLTRINSDGSAWQNLKAISIDGFFSMWVDHSGAIVWEKLPWSGKDQSLITGRNWENLPLEAIPSKFIMSWNDRISERGIANFIKCVGTLQGNPGTNPSGFAAYVYNQGSIRQYGGPTKKELQFPVGADSDQYYTSAPMRKQKATINSFTALCALECIRWYDRPVQRCGITMRGDAHLRIGTRLSITENWHNAKAKPGEYYVVSRSHSINTENGSWTTSLELVRDRRQRYLGIGIGEVPIVKAEGKKAEDKMAEVKSTSPIAALTLESDWKKAPAYKQTQAKPSKKAEILPSIDVPEYNVPLSTDDYWFFDRITGQVVRIGNDPIKYARENVIPKLGEKGKEPVQVIMPTADTGSVQTGPAGPGGGKFIAPFRSGIALGSVYDPAGTLNTRGRGHFGVDLFPSTEGDNTMLAIADGIVSIKASGCNPYVASGCGGGYGNHFEIAFSGVWSGWSALYAHCAQILVSNGQTVKAGQAISTMGNSGSSGGLHLHCEIRKNSDRVNPMRYLPAPSQRFTSDAGADMFAGG